MAGGLTLSEESLRRLVPPQAARNVFLTQTQEDPQAVQARAEGTLRAESEAKSRNVFNQNRIRLEEERLVQEARQFEAARADERRRRKREEPSFIETLFGK